MRLERSHLDHWDEHGYVVVPELFSADEVGAALEQVYAGSVPRPEAVAADPAGHKDVFFGVTQWFPFGTDAVNDLVSSDALLDVASHRLGADDIVLTAAGLVAKYGGTMSFEQDMHVDYGNNTVAFPARDDGPFGCVAVIVYLTEVTEDLGPTYVVSRQHHRHDPLHTPFRPKPDDLYEHEVPVVGPPGTTLFYGLRTYHRGSEMRAKDGHRVTLHPVYRTTAAPWLQRQGFAASATLPELHRYIERTSVRGRSLVGFPAPGHPYWDEEMLAGVAARYPGMDIAPYRDALERLAAGARA